MESYKETDAINRTKSLKTIIHTLSADDKQMLIQNIEIGKRATLAEIFQTVMQLIDEHRIIFDGKTSLFFKHTGKQIWLKHD